MVTYNKLLTQKARKSASWFSVLLGLHESSQIFWTFSFLSRPFFCVFFKEGHTIDDWKFHYFFVLESSETLYAPVMELSYVEINSVGEINSVPP